MEDIVHLKGAISVQEEVGCRGAKVNANTAEPQLSIVFEGSPTYVFSIEGYLIVIQNMLTIN